MDVYLCFQNGSITHRIFLKHFSSFLRNDFVLFYFSFYKISIAPSKTYVDTQHKNQQGQ